MFSAGRLLQYGPVGLFLVAFFESTVFPIPPDVVLLPLAMMTPRLSLWYAFLTTAASVLGALAGYAVGRKAGRPALRRFFSEELVLKVEVLFSKYGGWAVGIAAFTPIPFKIFTFGAGIFYVPLFTFTAASIAGRGARFFLEGAMVYFLGDRAQVYLGTNFEIATLGLTAALLLATWLLPRVLPLGKKVRPPVLRSYLRRLRSLGTGFLTWAVLSVLFLIFALAFLEDLAGPGRQVLNGVLAPAFDKLLFVKAAPIFWRVIGEPWVMALLVLSGTAVQLRGRALPLSARYRLLMWLLLLASAAYAIERATLLYLTLVYGKGFVAPGGLLLAPCLVALGASLALWRRGAAWRAGALAVGGALATGVAGYAVLVGGSDPVAAMTSLVVSGFTFCLTMAVMTAVSVRYR